MKNKIRLIGKLATLTLLFGLLGCGNSKKEDANHIKVGVISGPETNVAEVAKKVAKEKYNLEVELITFNDYTIPNEVLNHGDIDVNVFQTQPFLDGQASQRGYKFATVGKTFIFPIAAYSKQLKTIDELKDGSSVTIPNDPTNGGRALLLLEKNGLLKLKEGVGIFPRVSDIIENPKKLKILELESRLLPGSLDDQAIALSVINNTYSVGAGYTLDKAIFIEDEDSPYVNIIVTKEDRKNDDKIQRFVKSYQSEEVNEIANKEFKGGAIKGW